MRLRVVNFHQDEWIPKKEILQCCCSNPHCNGWYIKVKEDQTTCWWTYVDSKH